MFGGDGASFAVSPADLASAREALAATATWVGEDLDLVMRVALVPVSAIRDLAGSALTALACWLRWFLIACASSQTTRDQRTADSATRSRTAVW